MTTLVLSRMAGESIVVTRPPSGEVVSLVDILVTVVEIQRERLTVRLCRNEPDGLDTWTTTLAIDATERVGTTKITVVHLRGDKVRLGFDTSKFSAVHRLEIWEAIELDKRAARRAMNELDEDGDGTAGSPATRPCGPKPPSLDVRLDEPID